MQDPTSTCDSLRGLPEDLSTCMLIHERPEQFEILLQAGFRVPADEPDSIFAFLHETLGISSAFINERIQTIFLDGRPVDDLDAAMIDGQRTLTLSAAMPGLLGATMRRGGFYSRMREGITHKPDATPAPQGSATSFLVRMRLLNFTARELAPHVLGKGIVVEREALADFLSKRPPAFWSGMKSCVLDGKEVATDRYRPEQWSECREHVLLKGNSKS